MKSTTLFLFIFTSLQTLRFVDNDLNETMYILSNISFTIYIISKLYLLRHEKYFFITPLFLASIRMFLLAYGLTIMIYYSGGTSISDFISINDTFYYLNNVMIYASIAFISMWYFYFSKINSRLSKQIFNVITNNGRALRKYIFPKWGLLYILFIVSVLCKLYMISLGIYGVLGTYFGLDYDVSYMQIIVYFSFAGTGASMIVYLYYFKYKKNLIQFIIFLSIDVFFSLFTGFKGPIIVTGLSIIIVIYLTQHRISKYYLIISLLFLFVAYNLVEPYRNYILNSNNFERKSLSGIIDGFLKAQDRSYIVDNSNILKEVVGRQNFSRELAYLQEYNIKHGDDESDPDFIFLIVSVPFQIIIPRVLWNDKPKSDLGIAFLTNKVLGLSYQSSTAFGPLGFLYMTGGITAIILGSFLIGAILRLATLFLTSGNWGSVLVFMAILASSTSLEGQFNFYIIIFVQQLVLGIIFQYFILKSTN